MHRVSVVVAVALVATVAHAEPTSTEEHRALMISAQVLKKEGRLVRARELLDACSRAACPEGEGECEDIRAFCNARATDVQNETPKILVTVKDDRGLAVNVAHVDVDGTDVAMGAPTPLDPGTHTAHASFAGRTAETTFVAERAKVSDVVVTLDLVEHVPHRPVPPLAWILGATTLVSTGVALGTGIYTLRSYAALDACRPFCDPSPSSTLQATAIVADVATIVAIGSAIATTVALLLRPTVVETRWIAITGGNR